MIFILSSLAIDAKKSKYFFLCYDKTYRLLILVTVQDYKSSPGGAKHTGCISALNSLADSFRKK